MVLDPDRVVLERQRGVEMLVIVIRVGAVVRMTVVLAKQVVADGVLGSQAGSFALPER
jgi:hypothetical protein